MKFNIANPVTGCQQTIVIDDEKRVAVFYDKRMGAEVNGDDVGEQFKGYVFKITGGQDKDGFAMKQGVLVKGRVRLLLSKENHATFRPKRDGMKKRKSVRGCIIGSDLAVINLAIIKTGDQEIEGLTTERKPRRLGPKRANHIRKLFNLKKDDDVRLYVVRREIVKGGKTRVKAPKIQRLITEERLRRKRVRQAEKKERWQRRIKAIADYQKVVTEHKKRQAAQRAKKEEEKTTGKVAPVDPKTVKKTDTKATTATKTAATKPVDTKKADTKTTTATKPTTTKPTTTATAPAKKTTKK